MNEHETGECGGPSRCFECLEIRYREIKKELAAEKDEHARDNAAGDSAFKAMEERAQKAEAIATDSRVRMEAAERCSGQWMKDRNLAIKQRDRAEAQIWSVTGRKLPIFIHDGEVCPVEAQVASLTEKLEDTQREVSRLFVQVTELGGNPFKITGEDVKQRFLSAREIGRCQLCGGVMSDFNAHYDRCITCSAPAPRSQEKKL